MTKDNIREYLIAKGRGLVTAQGAAFLTARKLAEASGCSVGTIYNQFANMDNFIMAENLQTLDELSACLRKLQPDSSAYKTLNRYLDGFVRLCWATAIYGLCCITFICRPVPANCRGPICAGWSA